MKKTTDKVISFSDAKKRQKNKSPGLKPAFPTKKEVECFKKAADAYMRSSPNNPPPYWMHDGRILKGIWDDMIVPIAKEEGVDPWDIAGILFSSSHGMDFIYEEGEPVRVIYKPDEED